VLPTVLDVLEVEAPWPIDGQSVFTARTDPTKPFWPSRMTPFGPEALDVINVQAITTLDEALTRGPATLLGPAAGGDSDPAGSAGVSGTDRLWSVGPARDVVGTTVDKPPPDTRFEPVTADIATAVDLMTISSGGLAWGTSNELSPGDIVAVAINGVVAATGFAFDDDGRTGWAVMAPAPPRGRSQQPPMPSQAAQVAVYRVTR
jgi:hypothetical protein